MARNGPVIPYNIGADLSGQGLGGACAAYAPKYQAAQPQDYHTPPPPSPLLPLSDLVCDGVVAVEGVSNVAPVRSEL